MFFRDKYNFLSNFFPCTVKVKIGDKELRYSNAEAAFQAFKNIEIAENFCLLKPLEAKRLGKEIEITTPNWKTERLYCMAKVLNAKFKDLSLLFMLKCVKEEIVEDNYWNDKDWGRCKGEGHNYLGKLLMNIRDNDNDLDKLNEYITNILSKE